MVFVGYIGYEQATPFLLSGLERLEYRGYDFSGICLCNGSELIVKKSRASLLS